jgi:tetratricopeptide (TPR) repeat protein
MTPPGIALALLTPWGAPALKWLLAIPVLLIGAFVIFLRNAGHVPPELRLRRKGLDSLIAGRPGEAEKYFRRSLAMHHPSDQVRPLVCLADALMDQGRYEESKRYLVRAIGLGDATGSGQGSMADLLLLTGADPEKALDMADLALELTTRTSRQDIYFKVEVRNDLRHARYWGRRAQALAQLDRRAEARQAIDRASRLVKAAHAEAQQKKPHTPILAKLILGGRRLAHSRNLALATAHWKIGLAFLAIDDSSKAADHFRITRDTDRKGKYRDLARKQLKRLESRV